MFSCVVIHSDAFEACHEVLPPRLVFESCITSLCATLPAEEHLCRSVELYADECRLHGVDVKPWRSRDLCGKFYTTIQFGACNARINCSPGPGTLAEVAGT